MKGRLILLIIMAIFVVHALGMNFTQDDAFISYRYVENFIQGNGLVFNFDERVEGYTNFFWIVLLAVFARLGFDMIVVSKILGIASGCVILYLLYQISSLVFSKKEWWLALLPSVLLTANSAFAYWSISGLETSFFVMMVLLSVYLYLARSRGWVISSVVSTLVRPEGVLIFGILLLHQLLFVKGRFKKILHHLAGFLLLLLPFAIFKVLYYGDILPNPFYAKTGISFEYIRSGIDYFWLFLRHYGLWGILYLIPIALYRELQVKGKLALLIVYIYSLYVVLIGGDVLKAHRFFMPVVPFLYLLFVFTFVRLPLMLKNRLLKLTIPLSIVIALSILTFLLPRNWIMNVRSLEIGLCFKMSETAKKLRQSFGTDFTLAASTIGAISYISEAKVIDMLGLTDAYIARHPESLPGISPSWKEKKYNSLYLLSRNPEVIVFSTGLKPSAPAERALLLSSKFRENYYPYYFPFPGINWLVVFRKKGEYLKENEVFPDAGFVSLYHEFWNLWNQGRTRACLDTLNEILKAGPKDFAWPYEHMSECHLLLGNREKAKEYARKAVEMDDYITLAHSLLHDFYLEEGDSVAARQEREKILQYNPEMIQPR